MTTKDTTNNIPATTDENRTTDTPATAGDGRTSTEVPATKDEGETSTIDPAATAEDRTNTEAPATAGENRTTESPAIADEGRTATEDPATASDGRTAIDESMTETAERILALVKKRRKLRFRELWQRLALDKGKFPKAKLMALVEKLHKEDKLLYIHNEGEHTLYSIEPLQDSDILDLLSERGDLSFVQLGNKLFPPNRRRKNVELKTLLDRLVKQGFLGLKRNTKYTNLYWQPTKENILKLFKERAVNGLTYDDICDRLPISSGQKQELLRLLTQLQQENIIKLSSNGYRLCSTVVPKSVALLLCHEHDGHGSPKAISFSSLCRHFDLETCGEQEELERVLDRFEKKGLVAIENGQVSYRPRLLELQGRCKTRGGGFYVRFDEPEASFPSSIKLEIPSDDDCNYVLPGDLLLVRVDANRIKFDTKTPAVLVRRLASCDPFLLSVYWNKDLQRFGGHPLFHVGETPLQYVSFFFDKESEDKIHGKDRVFVEPVFRDSCSVTCRVVQNLGNEHAISNQEKLVKLNHKVATTFSKEVEEEVQALSRTTNGTTDPAGGKVLSDQDGARTDLRDLPFVTMDGADARDFDDAICVEKKGSDRYLLRVAIADVSLYVRPRSALDREALARGNSWYFPTSVEPMLPELLSNDLCSLVPGEDRPVVWVNITFSATGQVLASDFGEGLIRSAARLTYDQAKALVLDQDEEALDELTRTNARSGDVLAMLPVALELYRILARARRARGSLDFDLPDTEASFDERGLLVSLRRSERHDMHRLIEEFMIAANEAVATFLAKSELPFLYRIHPAPSAVNMTALTTQLRSCGFVARSQTITSRNLPQLLEQVRGTAAEHVVHQLCVRHMAQARYCDINIGHYGLASQAYCHFTSPIRRYADLLVHRALKNALGRSVGIPAGKRLMRIADMLNTLEKRTKECEREMNKRLSCLWMKNQPKGKEWTGTVSAVLDFGVFVELDEAPVEGLIRTGGWYDDWYGDWHARPATGWYVGSRCRVSLLSMDMGTLYINFKGERLKKEKEKKKKELG